MPHIDDHSVTAGARTHRRLLLCLLVLVVLPAIPAEGQVIAGVWRRHVEFFVSDPDASTFHMLNAPPPVVSSTNPATVVNRQGSGSYSQFVELEADASGTQYMGPFIAEGWSDAHAVTYLSMRVVWIYDAVPNVDPGEITNGHVVTVNETGSTLNFHVGATGTVFDARHGVPPPEYWPSGNGAASVDLLDFTGFLITAWAPQFSEDRTEYQLNDNDWRDATWAPDFIVLDPRVTTVSPIESLSAKLSVDAGGFADYGHGHAHAQATFTSGSVTGTVPAAAPAGEWQYFPQSGTIFLYFDFEDEEE